MGKYIFGCGSIFFAIILFTACQQHGSSAAATEGGAKLFDQYCATCHQGNGIGGPAPQVGLNAPDIRQFTKSQSELEGIITHGFGRMPAFGDSISAANISMIAAYVATQIEKQASADMPSPNKANSINVPHN
jgi:mono/diheme cytochrome c family protein